VDKCSFAVTAVEYLGYWLTRDGISPQPKKVEVIHRMTAPTNKKQLRRFLGMVNFISIEICGDKEVTAY
jgi:hypothetical protein